MAFIIGNKTVIHDADPLAPIVANSNVDVLQINGTDVLTHSGGTITLQNVNIADGVEVSINTDNLTEGTTNLFYDDALVDARITLQTGANLDLSSKTTTHLSEGTNLYYTAARWDSKLASADTSDLSEGSNLYYTDARSRSAISVSGDLAYNSTTGVISFSATTAPVVSVNSATGSVVLDTDDIAEGSTNLYYTDAQVNTLLGTKSYATETYVDTAETDAISTAASDATSKANAAQSAAISAAATDATTKANQALVDAKAYADTAETDAVTTANAYTDAEISAIVDGAPGTLDTLNELAAALGDDANLSTTLSTQIGTKVAKAGDTMTGALTLSGAPSSANHAATKAYVDASVSGGTGGLDTDDITEASNLYYTDARVDARIPTTVSSFTNDSGYATTGQLPTNNNQLTNGAGYITSFTNTTYTAGTGLNLVGTEFQNTAPDQTVSLTGSGATSISGTYPNFTISSTDTNTNTTYTAGNGLTLNTTEFEMSGSYTGDFTATGDVTAYSDQRLKRNVETITNAVDVVNCLRGVNFEKDGRHSTGVIAQEIEEFFPEVVHTDADGMKSVAYGNISGLLIEAIKEQQKTIEDMKKHIYDLQTLYMAQAKKEQERAEKNK